MRLFCFALLTLTVSPAVADETQPDASTPANSEQVAADVKELSDADADELIKQLNSDRFSKRQAATKRLAEAGANLIPRLIKAAKAGPTESAARVVEILEQHLKGDNQQTKQAAQLALRQLADDEQANASRLAKRALGETVPEDSSQEQPVEKNQNPFRFGNGQFQFQMRLNGGGGRRVTRRNVNGVKDATIEEQGKKIKIHEEPNGKLRITVTEKDANGQPKATEYQADSLDALKQKHPAAHKIYEKYSGDDAIGPIQIRQVPGVPPIQPQRVAELRRIRRILEQLKEMNLKDIDEETRESLQEELDRLQKELKPE